MALESVHLRRYRNACELSEERRKEFRKFGIFGPMWAPRARRLKMRQQRPFPRPGSCSPHHSAFAQQYQLNALALLEISQPARRASDDLRPRNQTARQSRPASKEKPVSRPAPCAGSVSIQSAMERATTAEYLAKRSGPNSTHFVLADCFKASRYLAAVMGAVQLNRTAAQSRCGARTIPRRPAGSVLSAEFRSVKACRAKPTPAR
jgi:hypothetical protein